MLRKLFPILLLTFVNIIGFTLLIPVLPVIVERYAPPEYSGVLYGALLSSYALFQFLASPFLGSLSDRFGRRPLLFLSQLGTLISWVIFGVAYFVPEWHIFGIALPLYVIAFSRVIDGITGGNVSVANAWVADSTERHEKAQAFGIIGATFGIGFLVGPALGGISSSLGLGYFGTALIAFAISLITLIIIKYYLPESLPKEKRDHAVELKLGKQLNIIGKFAEFSGNMFISRILVLRLFFTLAFSSYVTLIILYLKNTFGLSPTALGITLSAIGLFSIFNQAVVVKKVVAKIGEVRTLYLGISLVASGLLALPLLPTGLPALSVLPGILGTYSGSFFLVMLNAFVMNLGISLSGPNFKSLLANSVPDNKQGVITGLDESLSALGNAITPMIAGALFVAIGTGTFAAFAGLLLLPVGYFYLRSGSILPRS
jgi:MFS transporter, DHA1 family, tetracycline resistance protein